MSPLAPTIVVFEKSPRWEAELKRRFRGLKVRVRPCRSSSDAFALCKHAPGSVAVLDFAVGPADVLQLLERLLRLRSTVLPIVIGCAETAELEWPAHELGALAYVTDRIGGAALARFCQRALAGADQPQASQNP